MANIPNTIPYTAVVAPTSPLDTYAVTDSQYNRGGFRVVADVADIQNVTPDRCRVGMWCYCITEDVVHRITVVGANPGTPYGHSSTQVTMGGASSDQGIITGLTSTVASLENNQFISFSSTADQVVLADNSTNIQATPATNVAGVAGAWTCDDMVVSQRRLTRYGVSSLTPGSAIFISTVGSWTHTAPSATGTTIQVMGTAINTTQYLLNIQQPILQ